MNVSPLPARLSLTNDLVFKALFTSSEEILVDLLTAVLLPPVPIERAIVQNPELTRAFPDEKGGFLDISIRLADGTLLDVEMQRARGGAFSSRALYYWARLFSSQLASGEPHRSLAPTKCILFLDYVEFSFPNFHEIFGLVGRRAGATFSELIEIHTIEFPKLPAAATNRVPSKSEEQALERWCRFFVTRDSEELSELTRGNPMIAKADQKLLELSADEKLRQRLLEEERREVAHRLILGAAYDEGMALGLAEGRHAGHEIGLKEGRDEGRSEGRAVGRGIGREEGRREAARAHLARLVERRRLPASSEARQRVASCEDLELLETWLERAWDATSLDEIVAR